MICNFLPSPHKSLMWSVGSAYQRRYIWRGYCWCRKVNVVVPCLSRVFYCWLQTDSTTVCPDIVNWLFWLGHVAVTLVFLLTENRWALLTRWPFLRVVISPLACCNYNAMWYARALQLKTVAIKPLHNAVPQASFSWYWPTGCLLSHTPSFCHCYHQLWLLLSVMVMTVAFGGSLVSTLPSKKERFLLWFLWFSKFYCALKFC